MSSLAPNYRKSKNAQIDHKTSNLIVYMVLSKTSVNIKEDLTVIKRKPKVHQSDTKLKKALKPGREISEAPLA
jgi:hypothetical protein